jgi:hypothetical protein
MPLALARKGAFVLFVSLAIITKIGAYHGQ